MNFRSLKLRSSVVFNKLIKYQERKVLFCVTHIKKLTSISKWNYRVGWIFVASL